MIETLQCKECGAEMLFMHYYRIENKYDRMTTGDVFHCPGCGEDEVVERRWECVSEERKKYWQG